MRSFAFAAFVLPVLGQPTLKHVGRQTTTSEPQSMCGAPDAYEIIDGTPWIVYSMNYNYEVRRTCPQFLLR